jgi:hypothetical protein
MGSREANGDRQREEEGFFPVVLRHSVDDEDKSGAMTAMKRIMSQVRDRDDPLRDDRHPDQVDGPKRGGDCHAPLT